MKNKLSIKLILSGILFILIIIITLLCFRDKRPTDILPATQQDKNQQVTKEQFKHAVELMNQKNFDEAVGEFQKLAQVTDDLAMYSLIEECYKQQNLKSAVTSNARNAIRKGEELLVSHPNQHHLYIYIGLFYDTLEEWTNARNSFQKYIDAIIPRVKDIPALRARLAEIHIRIAETYEKENKWSEMIQEYQRVIDDTENQYRVFKAEAQFSIAEAFLIHGAEIFGTAEKAKEESLQVYQQVIDNYPWRECTEWREKAQERIIELRKR